MREDLKLMRESVSVGSDVPGVQNAQKESNRPETVTLRGLFGYFFEQVEGADQELEGDRDYFIHELQPCIKYTNHFRAIAFRLHSR